jgi:hypothetical protein
MRTQDTTPALWSGVAEKEGDDDQRHDHDRLGREKVPHHATDHDPDGHAARKGVDLDRGCRLSPRSGECLRDLRGPGKGGLIHPNTTGYALGESTEQSIKSLVIHIRFRHSTIHDFAGPSA